MREEINRILKLVEDGKLTGDQASAMIDALDAADRRSRNSERRHRSRHARHRRGGSRAFGGLLDELGVDIGRAVEDALRGLGDVGGLAQVFGGADGDDWVDDTNRATLAKVEEPTGQDYKAEGNRIVVSELKRLALTQAEFCDNTMHAAALQDVEVTNGPLSRNTLRGSSLKRASLTASEVTGNTLNGASLSRLSVTSSVFADNTVNGAQIRELSMQSAEVRSTKINGSKLKDINLTGRQPARPCQDQRRRGRGLAVCRECACPREVRGVERRTDAHPRSHVGWCQPERLRIRGMQVRRYDDQGCGRGEPALR